MDAALLKSLFGPAPAWSRPCIVVVDAEASVRPAGQDTLLTGGAKTYAPRITSGRIDADVAEARGAQSRAEIAGRGVERRRRLGVPHRETDLEIARRATIHSTEKDSKPGQWVDVMV